MPDSNIYGTLNRSQLEAVLATKGPVLMLAGAGSGKTRALTHRIAYLIDEEGVAPWHILAITFTNKAAGEMKERVCRLIPEGAGVWVATFHATCARILRTCADRLGYERDFSIYDTDDQRALMKSVIKAAGYDPKLYREREILARISSMKNDMIDAHDFSRISAGNFREERVATLYEEYQARLKKNNAMDFDDLLVNTVRLLEQNPDILENYRERFRYIMVDEYQDTNTVQFRMVELLARNHHNLCVVGDDDQSIYKFRGANIRNILDFEKFFPEARVIRLEQNYRSTKSILEAANGVIRHNRQRKAKTLWTDNEPGGAVVLRRYNTAYEEAEGIVRDIVKNKERFGFGSCAVLYRTNAQSRLLEEKCIAYNVPYQLVGGVNFYQRKEIKDVLCYLKTIANGQDDIAVQRIINVPARGIGATTVAKIASHALSMGMSFYEGIAAACTEPAFKRSAAKLAPFVELIESLKKKAVALTVAELLEELLTVSGYRQELEQEEGPQGESRLANVQELMAKAADFGDEPGDEEALGRFLEEVALVAEVDNLSDESERVILMTLHSAKGLEFPKVYLSGMEDGLFPSYRSVNSDDPTDLEEERRLCYVGITRAQSALVLTAARMRMVNGETMMNPLSRFIDEIPAGALVQEETGYVPPHRPAPGAERSPSPSAAPAFGRGTGAPVAGGGFGRSTGRAAPAAGFGKVFDLHASAGMPGKRAAIGEKPDYEVGDRVRHPKFGPGVVVELKAGKRDYEVSLLLDTGEKKSFLAAYAALERL